jgi:hypothetical protein
MAFMDVLTHTAILRRRAAGNLPSEIEDWKEALGQVIAKGQSFPKLTKRIHLFGESSKQLKKITQNCQTLDVLVTFEKIRRGATLAPV